jgi:two-component system chemotaxis sensor kinase CheA
MAESHSVKVDTNKLDALVDMVGEMVIAQSLIRHDPDLLSLDRPRLSRNITQLARITDEVQKTAMSMRMVPVRGLFQRMSRLVRDLALKSGKRIALRTDGDDTELDRHIVEELADPMMHMVRNAADHGIEPPADRKARGKVDEGRIDLRARHQSGRILIEIADDGRGLDYDRILAKARSLGLVQEGDQPPEADVFNLIFHPGFSTAATVTDVSGRGVGMDVVRRQITKLRGRVEIQSAAGKGTTFSIKLPLTLAIIDGLVVAAGGEKFIVPIGMVREVLQVREGMVFTVEGRNEMILARGSLLPIVRLCRHFEIAAKSEDATKGVVVVVEADSRRYCLLVDELIGKQEVVIKSLGDLFKGVRGLAGGAILGDGRIGLVLDAEAIGGVSVLG